jgi:hypothetical protein
MNIFVIHENQTYTWEEMKETRGQYVFYGKDGLIDKSKIPDVFRIAYQIDSYLKSVRFIPVLLSLPGVKLEIEKQKSMDRKDRFVRVGLLIKSEQVFEICYLFDSNEPEGLIQLQIEQFFRMILNNHRFLFAVYFGQLFRPGAKRTGSE